MAPSLRIVNPRGQPGSGHYSADGTAGPCTLGRDRRACTRAELRRLGLLPEIGAVVLTVNGGSDSYDQLFSTVRQRGPGGTSVAVYEANYEALGAIVAALQGDEAQPAIYQDLAQDVQSLADAQHFVANLECCGCCSEQGFPSAATAHPVKTLWHLVELCLSRGSMIMASDFSLKAIIKDWDPEHLGPLPFSQLPGGCSTSFDLGFDSDELVASPSAQLNVVGQLCADGSASSHAMGGTIVYCLDEAGAEAARAAGVGLKVLTVVEKVDGMACATDPRFMRRLSTAGGRRGLAGHVLLTYPSGGKLLTSMGHWIELTKLHGCSEASVLRAAESRGSSYASKIRDELDGCASPADKSQLLQRYGAELVQSAAPCMVQNNAGGLSFEVDDSTKLLRFLILGSDSGTYYVQPKESTQQNLAALLRMMEAGKGVDAVQIITSVSKEGRAVRQTPTLLALAMCCQLGDPETKRAAYAAVPSVCRIPTHLFEFLALSEATATSSSKCKGKEGGSTGWGRAHRRAIGRWYNDYRSADASALAEAVTKYGKRQGWSHLDALRLCHAAPATPAHAVLFRYLAKGLDAAAKTVEEMEGGVATPPPPSDSKKRSQEAAMAVSENEAAAAVLQYLSAVDEMKSLTETRAPRCVELIETHRLVREHVPSPLLGSAEVWRSLLKAMPMTALMRSLAKISAIGLLEERAVVDAIVAKLTNGDAVRKARLHPLAVLMAHRTYLSGEGDKGSLTWQPSDAVCKALATTFTLAFGSVRPAGKRFLLAVDISDSMSAPVVGGGGATLSCAEAAAAMALLIAKTEPGCTVMAFGDTFIPMPITADMSLEEATGAAAKLRDSGRAVGGTDCSIPMQWALRELLLAPESADTYDCFVVLTDNETCSGELQPVDAMCRYRKTSGVADARLITVGMASNGFSIADPADTGMLDVVGFDSGSPDVISSFAAGRF